LGDFKRIPFPKRARVEKYAKSRKAASLFYKDSLPPWKSVYSDRSLRGLAALIPGRTTKKPPVEVF
jgi:hypothetical protein